MLNQGIVFKSKNQTSIGFIYLIGFDPSRHIYLPFQDVFTIAKKCYLITKSVLLAIMILYYSLSWEQKLSSQILTQTMKLKELATQVHPAQDLELQMMKVLAFAEDLYQ